ncbi:MAG: hypothetical protein WEA31_09350 [Pirellulales bacterium]
MFRIVFVAPLIWATLYFSSHRAAAQMPRGPVHFKPAGHVLGDVHPYFHNGECFLFYLTPQRYESSLVRSADLLHWRPAQLSHRAQQQRDWLQPYFVLGVFFDPQAKLFRSFYGTGGGRMASSASRDLLQWECGLREFHVPPAKYYQQRRDPYIFWIPARKQYGCVMTTQMNDGVSRGAVTLATSHDLKHWTDHGAIIRTGEHLPECPQIFQLGERWYALASIQEAGPQHSGVGQPSYWIGESPLGPWSAKPHGVLDGRHLCAAQVARDGENLHLFGWIPLRAAARNESKSWGGHLALPREVLALPDGTLKTRLAPKLQKTWDKLAQPGMADFDISSASRFTGVSWPLRNTTLFANFDLGLPARDRAVHIELQNLGEIVFNTDRVEVVDAQGEMRSAIDVDLTDLQKCEVRLVVEDDIIEVFVAERWSLAARVTSQGGECRLSFSSDGGTGRVESLRHLVLKHDSPDTE